jgi:hypothetical protein
MKKYEFEFIDLQKIDFRSVLQYLGIKINRENEREIYVDGDDGEIRIDKSKNRYRDKDGSMNNVILFVAMIRNCSRYEAGRELYQQFKPIVDSYRKAREDSL